jgi:hypothetical protein
MDAITVKGFPVITAENKSFSLAKKTRPIKAKPINAILLDQSVASKFLLDTIEGHASLKAGSMVCIGEANDAWLQAPAKLLSKYDVTSIDSDGWITCTPKPDNEVRAVQIQESFCVFAHYGEDHVVDGQKRHVLFGKSGDYLLQSVFDPTDCWIVDQKLFKSTYQFLD